LFSQSKADIIVLDKEETIIIDVAAIMEENIKKAFNGKMQYKLLGNELIREKITKKYKIIPVIITTHGLIPRQTMEDTDKKLKINYHTVINNLWYNNISIYTHRYRGLIHSNG
jgi:hypothetical protein